MNKEKHFSTANDGLMNKDNVRVRGNSGHKKKSGTEEI